MEIIVPTAQDRLLSDNEIVTVPFQDRVLTVIWSTNGDSVVGESDPVPALNKSGFRVYITRGRILVSSYSFAQGSINRLVNDPVELLVTTTEQIRQTDDKLADLVEFVLQVPEQVRELAPPRGDTQTQIAGLI